MLLRGALSPLLLEFKEEKKMTMENVSWMLVIYLFINKSKLTDTPSERVYYVDNCR